MAPPRSGSRGAAPASKGEAKCRWPAVGWEARPSAGGGMMMATDRLPMKHSLELVAAVVVVVAAPTTTATAQSLGRRRLACGAGGDLRAAVADANGPAWKQQPFPFPAASSFAWAAGGASRQKGSCKVGRLAVRAPPPTLGAH